MSKHTLKGPPTALRFHATTKVVLLFTLFCLYFFSCKWINEFFHGHLILKNILLQLILYIFLYDFSVSSYCIYIISSTPKLPISIFVFQVRMPIKYH